MKVHIVYYITHNNSTVFEKAYLNIEKAIQYCDKEQLISDQSREYRDYYFKSIDVED